MTNRVTLGLKYLGNELHSNSNDYTIKILMQYFAHSE